MNNLINLKREELRIRQSLKPVNMYAEMLAKVTLSLTASLFFCSFLYFARDAQILLSLIHI